MRQDSIQALPLIQLIAFMERGREPKGIKFVQLGEERSTSQLKVANKAVVGKQLAASKDSLVLCTGQGGSCWRRGPQSSKSNLWRCELILEKTV